MHRAPTTLHGLARRLVISLLVSALPTGAALAAQPVAVEGTLQVLVEDHPQFARTRHFLTTDHGRLELLFKAKAPALKSGARLRVRGSQTGMTLALSTSDSGSVSVMTSAPLLNTAGEQKVAVLLVNFTDDTSQPSTLAQANDVVFNQTSAFMRENSFQTTWLSGNVFGWLSLPIAKTCLTSTIADAAKQAAANAGVNLAAYTRFVYVFPPNMDCGWSGVGTVGGVPSDAWINGAPDLKVIAHELGHNLGVQHSHSSDCDATPLGPTCTIYEYGDVADVMGNVTASHFNASQKERLGWLNSGAQPSITTVGGSGTFAVGAYESATVDAKALKVLKSTDATNGAKTWYYIEYRRPIGFDAGLSTLYASNLVNGVLIRTSTDGDLNSSHLLDMTPNTVPTFDLGDAALVPGQAFTDAAAGVTITVTGIDANQATVGVTLSAPSGCVRANPVVAASGGAVAVAAGTPLSYSVTVSNSDNAACGASVFNLQSTVPTGWSGSFASPALSLMPGAAATTTLTVASAAGTSAGTYPVGAKATNSASPTNTGSASGSYVVAGALVTSVSSNQALYGSNDTVALTASVSSGGKPTANASVSFRIIKPNGTVVMQTATTKASGIASTSYRVARKDPKGSWQVQDSASYLGATANAATSFTVQ